jgi:hypothetical protein
MDENKMKELCSLIEQWTRAEIIARHVPFNELKYNQEFVAYCNIQIDKKDEIRKLLFGTDDLVALGIRWGILKDQEKIVQEELNRQEKQVEDELAKIEAEILSQ